MAERPPAIFPSVIDNTMRHDFIVCPHRWFRRYCQGLRHVGISSIHLHFGQCFAKGLEVTRRAYCNGATPDAALLQGARDLLQEWGDAWSTEEVEALPSAAKRKTLPACLDALYSYFQHYPLETDRVRILRSSTGPFIEVSFAVPIPCTEHPESGQPIVYAGRFDMVGEIANSIWVVDDKTATQLGDSWSGQWALDAQPTGYCWGLREYGITPVGAIIRGVGIMTKEITFAESLQTRALWQIEQWLFQLQNDVARMCDYWSIYTELTYRDDLEGIAFPRALSRTACYEYRHPCQFEPLCTSPAPDRWMYDYVVERWDPLQKGEQG